MKTKSCNFLMSLGLLFAALSMAASTHAQNAKPDSIAILGRWDIVVDKSGDMLPSWLEIRHSGHHTLVGRFVYAFGSARPISEVKLEAGKFSFSIPPQFEPGNTHMQFEGTVKGDSLRGTMVYTDGKKYNWVAKRAPSLRREKNAVWGKPVDLFDGTSLKGWHTKGENQWIVESGILKSPKSGSNLISDNKFTDFKLHIEFRYPKGSNSGIYLRGRYEVQIADSKGLDAEDGQFSGIYGFLAPNQMVAKAAGEWQTFDITLIGRMVTVVANGVTVISEQVIPGITGGALDSNEGEPGPLFIQGDHGPVDFRKITITPAK